MGVRVARAIISLLLLVVVASTSSVADSFERGDYRRNSNGQAAYAVVLDLSGSMTRFVAGSTLKQAALDAVRSLATQLKAGLDAEAGSVAPFSLRVFGHRYDVANELRSCADTELVLPLGRHTADQVERALAPLHARGLTPLAAALAEVRSDLAGAPLGIRRRVILISDGADSCGGNPAETLRQLRAGGFDVTVYVFGVGLDRAARTQLAEIAAVTSGTFQEITQPRELKTAIGAALSGALPQAAIPVARSLPSIPIELPGDAEAPRDAGETRESAIRIDKNKPYVGEVGTLVRGEQTRSDPEDLFVVRVTTGDKYRLLIEELRGGSVDFSVRTVLGNRELVSGSSVQGETEPFLIEEGSSELIVSIKPRLASDSRIASVVSGDDEARRQYRLTVMSLVQIEP